MEEAIKFIGEWNGTYNLGMIKIADQKYIGSDFYKNNQIYTAVNSISIISFRYPEAAGDRLFVWGSDASKNRQAIVCHDYERFNRYVEALHAYNKAMGVAKDSTDEHKEDKQEIDTLKQKLAAAEELLENLKCCENCKYHHSDYDEACLLDGAFWPECCDNWQYDGLRAKQREQIK